MKRTETPGSISRAAVKADQAREGARAMQDYADRRAQAVAKMARLRALRLAHERAFEERRNAVGEADKRNGPGHHTKPRAGEP